MSCKFKQILSVTLVVALTFASLCVVPPVAYAADTWDGSTAAGFAGGSGTAQDPYRIAAGAELAFLAQEIVKSGNSYADKHYILTDDINLYSIAWTPIGDTSTPFKGVFDGNGHYIANMNVAANTAVTNKRYVGLFSYIDGGTVKNLTVTGSVTKNYADHPYVGGIAGGMVNGATILNCQSAVNVTSQLASAIQSICAGGIAGYVLNSSILNSYFTGTVSTKTNSNASATVGGIAGQITGSSTIKNCYVNGALTATNNENLDRLQLGAISGNAGGTTTITTSYYNSTAAQTRTYSGGTNTTKYDVGSKSSTGTITVVAYNNGDSFVYNLNQESIKTKDWSLWSTNTGAGNFPFFLDSWVTYTEEPSFDGTTYTITTAEELAWIASSVNTLGNNFSGKIIKLTNDINLNAHDWVSIGYSLNSPALTALFSGTFDGGGYTISNMKVVSRSLGGASTRSCTGLFGAISGAILRDVTVKGSINDQNIGIRYGGGLAGFVMGTSNTVENCHSAVNISAVDGGGVSLGGLIGYVNGTDHLNVINSGATGTINGKNNTNTNSNLGGFIGLASSATKIQNCYATGNVAGTKSGGSGMYAGGFAGNINGGIYENCYAAPNSVTTTGTGISNAAFIGVHSNVVTSSNCYYRSDIGLAAVGYANNASGLAATGETASGMQGADFARELNKNAREITGAFAWKQNTGYPFPAKSAFYTVTYDVNGGTGPAPEPQQAIRFDNELQDEKITLPDGSGISMEGYHFIGWNTEADGSGITYAAGDLYSGIEDVTLYAHWRNNIIIEVNDNTNNDSFSVTQSNLDEVFNSVVTSADLEGDNIVTLALNVSDISDQTEETEAIKAVADSGSEVYFFDATLTKSVNNGADVTETTLTTVPTPVEIHIKLTDNLAGKTYYRVYRYHDGLAEQISSDPKNPEHFVVDVPNSEIIIYTKKFSTYAIFGNDASLNFEESGAVDVQAKVIGEGGAVYKIDLAWGAMTFEYSTSGVWNPETHSYKGDGEAVGWREEGFRNGNNRITAWNHSNGDVKVSFSVIPEITGVAMTMHEDSLPGSAEAVGLSLDKVPYESAEAKNISAYLRLDGEPENLAASDDKYTKIAVITATIEAMGGELTPKD